MKNIRGMAKAERQNRRYERRQCPACGKWFINCSRKGWHCSNECRDRVEGEKE
jgi:hypothetical protein